jgi:hypothetical protein
MHPFEWRALPLGIIIDSWTIYSTRSIATVVSALDMLMHAMTKRLRVLGGRRSSSSSSFPNQSKQIRVRRYVDRLIFPFKFRATRFLRSLRTDRWAAWPRINAMILLSFILQNMEQFRHGFFGFQTGQQQAKAGVYRTFGFGLVGLAAGFRVLHCIKCAENNMMLRRQVHHDERVTVRVCELVGVLAFVIHVAACLWCIIARIELGPDVVDPISSSFFPNQDLLLGGLGILNAYVHAQGQPCG